MSIYVIGVAGMFIVYVTIGAIMGARVKNSADYYVAGRRAGTLLIVGTLISSYLSTVAFMGEVAYSYDGFPVSYLILVCISSCGYIFGSKFFGVYLRRSKVYTIPEYFGKRFNSTRIKMLTSIITVVGITCYLVSVTQGASLIMAELLGTSYLVALLIIWVVYTSFTFYAGSNGIVITETMMFLIFTAMAFITVPYIISEGGGWPQAIIDTVLQSDKPGILSFGGVTTGEGAYMGTALDTVTYGVVLGIVWFGCISCSPWQASRYLLARDEQVVVRSGITASIIILLMMAFLHIAVTTINLINPAIVPSEMCYIWMALNKLPIWLGVVVCGGIMSAALSSCATFASLIGFSISNDILPYFVKSMRDQDEKKNIRNSRITMLIVGIVTLVITYFQPPAVMWIAYFAATLFAVSWLYMSFGSIWLKKVNERGAFYSMLFGAVSFVVCQIMVTFFGFSFPTLLRPEIIGFLFSIIGYAIFNPTSSQSKEEIEFRNSIFEKTEKFTITEIKRTLNYTKILIASGVLLILIMVIWYYYPYSVAMQ